MRFWKKSKKKSKPLDTFTSIHDCPVKVWFDIHKTSDCLLLLKEPQNVEPSGINFLWELFDCIYNEYIKEFDFSEEFKMSLNDEIELANYQAELVITGDRSMRTMMNIQKERIRINKKDISKPANLETLLAKMSKHYGFKLSSRELSIAEYYSYLKNIGNG